MARQSQCANRHPVIDNTRGAGIVKAQLYELEDRKLSFPFMYLMYTYHVTVLQRVLWSINLDRTD